MPCFHTAFECTRGPVSVKKFRTFDFNENFVVKKVIKFASDQLVLLALERQNSQEMILFFWQLLDKIFVKCWKILF